MENQRLYRALKQRMYLISATKSKPKEWFFEVEGYSGTIYTLEFNQEKMQCTCPDYQQRFRICKHIYFIVGRVLKNIQLISSLTDPNISIFDISDDNGYNITNKLTSILNPRLQETSSVPEQTKPDEDCAICFENYKNSPDNSQCNTCKKHFHKDCIKVWLRKATRSTCPLCRSSWIPDTDDGENDPMGKFKKLRKIGSESLSENHFSTELSGNSFR